MLDEPEIGIQLILVLPKIGKNKNKKSPAVIFFFFSKKEREKRKKKRGSPLHYLVTGMYFNIYIIHYK